ncbi:MAG: endonuclease/exonuclease/phosphatase family protein [Bacteriovoracaceae bacterium]|nr:endonuclease/exonuclease/phosphatase family protein [Bacteriovoracaceae bacterium]
MKIKILSYNVNKSRSWKFVDDTSDKIKKIIIESNADIVFLQEVVGENSNRNISKPHYEELADEIWTEFAYGKNAVYEKGHHGNVILSKFPLVKWEQENLSTNRFEQRGLLYAKIEPQNSAKKIPIHLYCLHLDLLFKGRKQQIERIIERIKSEVGDDAFIIAGDFNDWDHRIGNMIENALNVKDCSAIINGEYLKTFPSFYPSLKLDRVYIKNGITLSAATMKYTYSDHLPLLCEVSIES